MQWPAMTFQPRIGESIHRLISLSLMVSTDSTVVHDFGCLWLLMVSAYLVHDSGQSELLTVVATGPEDWGEIQLFVINAQT